MPADRPDIPVDFSRLENDYQILTELHRDGDTPTYLARHTGLNRDVTITVVRAAGDRGYLDDFAQDARLLADKRNPAIVPVIEGRWLDEHTFAIIRARVRGTTLDQLLSAIGTMPEPRVQATLRQVASALGWARANGVRHRRVSAQSVVFQQGSGRVLLALEPWPRASDDMATIRSLAARMSGGAQVDATELAALLAAGAIADPARPTPVADAPVPITPAPIPADRGDETVVIHQKRGMGFNGRLMSAIVVLAVLMVVAGVFIHRRDTSRVRVNSTANGVLDSMGGEAAGESALHAHRADTAASVEEPPVNPVIIEPQPVSPAPLPPPPDAARPIPARPVPRAPDTAGSATAGTGDACASSSPADQHRCLVNAITSNDQALNSVYQQLISALRRQASVEDGDADPPAVIELRSEQRRWLEDRDAACHNVGDGPLYARERSACYGDRSSERTKELRQRLDDMGDDTGTESGLHDLPAVLLFRS
ncbi:MAG TPA: lysozyme inhibitor LprI family protein [Gemmatimonadaceae bacterium]|jgi:uncharacterized protein YecT (DUF1311 family)|nr:lysozyme inhibitor LprI family protein [Gemmatimonadaceae bacterium]